MGIVNPQPQFDYVLGEFDSNVAIYEDLAPRLSLVSAGLRLESWRYRSVKRGLDVVFSVLMIVACLVPGLLIAAAIALTSKGAIFYRETRIGRGGEPFCIW